MENFWRESLEEIYDNFLTDLDKMDDYCELCEVCFTPGRVPDYASTPQQNLYLLRYFSAYLFEYYEAFSMLKKAAFLDDIPRIASLGCGSGIDGAAVNCVFDDFTYGGIDRVEWDTWFAEEPPHIGDANDFIPVSENIFVFPKSLGELPQDVVTALARNLPRTSAKKVCIINSRRGTDTRDQDACDLIIQGFAPVTPARNNVEQLELRGEERRGLIQHHRWFSYPQKIIDTISQLSSKCPAREGCPRGECADAPCPRHGSSIPCWTQNIPMQRKPVLSDSNFSTDIYLIDRT